MTVKALKRLFKKKGFAHIEISQNDQCVVLQGEMESWEAVVRAGYLAANKGLGTVLNKITLKGFKAEEAAKPSLQDTRLDKEDYDVCIIGGGIMGCSIARELSRYKLRILLVEKEEDIAKHASSRNDGMIHPGFAAKPGTKKAYYNVRGNAMYDTVCHNLNVPFVRRGSLLLFRSRFSKLAWPIIKARIKKNNVPRANRVSRKEVFHLEPNVSPKQYGGILFSSAGVLCPYELTTAYAENAVQNAVKISLDTYVESFDRQANRLIKIHTNRGSFSSHVVINAAGIWSDVIAAKAGDEFFTIHPRKGMDAILDMKTGNTQNHIMALVKLIGGDKHSKGGGIVKTIEGNLLIGPTAKEVPYREDYSTSHDDLDALLKRMDANTCLNASHIITYFSGIRAASYEEDFFIGPSKRIENLIHVAGIQSPGLASAPAIADDVAKFCVEMLEKIQHVEARTDFNPIRLKTPAVSKLSAEEKDALIKENPSYGRIVCRCEEVSEGEIRAAVHRPVAATTLDAIKRRTRAGMGRCHGGFCTPYVLDIIAEERNIPVTDITKKGHGSQIIFRETKESAS